MAVRGGKGSRTFDTTIKEMNWQGAKQRGEKQDQDRYLESIYSRITPIVFIGMRAAVPWIQIIHSISKFHRNPVEEDDYNGNIIGFLGD